MTIYRLISAALPAIFFLTTAAIAASGGAELLLTGTFHGDEVAVTDGAEMLGLFSEGESFALEQVRVKVETVEDVVLDPPGTKTGKEVSIVRKDTPVFMVKGIDGLSEGPVATVFNGWDWMKQKAEKTVELDGTTYTLAVTGEAVDEWNVRGYTLTLSSGGVSQQLAYIENCCDDVTPALIWAGDLDGDGRLDLFMDLSGHYNVGVRTLFLSTLAGDGELAGVAAKLTTYGC